MKSKFWKIHINNKVFNINFEYSAIFKKKIVISIDNKKCTDVSIMVNEFGADYFFNIEMHQILIYCRIVDNKITHKIALDGIDCISGEKVQFLQDEKKKFSVIIFISEIIITAPIALLIFFLGLFIGGNWISEFGFFLIIFSLLIGVSVTKKIVAWLKKVFRK